MIMGYDMFRNLANPTATRIRKKVRESLQTSLIDPGPELIVCDEGHLLKNEKTSLSQAVNRISTMRRIVLTGTPIQNNMKECEQWRGGFGMVAFLNYCLILMEEFVLPCVCFRYRLLYGSVCKAQAARYLHRVHEPVREPHHEWTVHRLDAVRHTADAQAGARAAQIA